MRYRQSGWISISPSIQGNLVVGRDTSRFQIVTFFDARPLKKVLRGSTPVRSICGNRPAFERFGKRKPMIDSGVVVFPFHGYSRFLLPCFLRVTHQVPAYT